jgi:hypothetical protein
MDIPVITTGIGRITDITTGTGRITHITIIFIINRTKSPGTTRTTGLYTGKRTATRPFWPEHPISAGGSRSFHLIKGYIRV